MQEWITQTLESPALGITVPAAAFLLGLISAIASACCALPVLGAIVGYSGTTTVNTKKTSLPGAVFFMVGTIIAIMILGSVAAFLGQAAQISLGKYWKLFAGFIAILFGLGTLKLLPFRLQQKNRENKLQQKPFAGTAALSGLFLGGAVSVCSMGCNPGIFIILAVVAMKGYSLWAMTILITYAIGFSLPLAAIVFGVSLGKTIPAIKKIDSTIRIIAGILLIAAGFYFLATI